MHPIVIQRLLATVFLGLGGWAMLFPATVERLVFTSEYYTGTPASQVIMACFGAQAVLGGVVMFFARFEARTFLIFGIVGSIPFFVFNYYFVFVVEMFSNWMLLDFAGNIAIFTLCMMGYRGLSASPEVASAGEKE